MRIGKGTRMLHALRVMSSTICVIGGCNGAGKSTLAVERVRLRVLTGGHNVPEEDIRRRFQRSVRHFLDDYLPLADEWGLWVNAHVPAQQIADNSSHTLQQVRDMITSTNLQESPPMPSTEMSKIVLEASRAATVKMLDLYARMGIKVTLAPDSPPPAFKPFEFW